MAAFIIASFLLALAFCAPPGAITAEALRRGTARGFRSVLLLELGSLIGDAFWAILAMAGAVVLVQHMSVRLLLGLFGTALLLRLAWSALRDAHAGAAPATPGKSLAYNDFMTGALLSLANPFALAFWLGVGSSFIVAHIPQPQPHHFVLFFLTFMLGAFLWCFFFAGLITWGRRYLSKRFFSWVNLLCGLALASFGLQLFWQTIGALIY